MNILFFLMPKHEVAFLYDSYNLRQIIEKFDHYKYSAMPIIDRNGRYVGTITEGDILRKLRSLKLNLENSSDIHIDEIPRRTNNDTVNVSSNMEDIISHSVRQNFIPVVDDDNVFIGIITRKSVIEYLYAKTLVNNPAKTKKFFA